MSYSPIGFGAGAAGTPGHAIKVNGSNALAQRGNLNIIVPGAAGADDSGQNQTNVTLPSPESVPLIERAGAWVTFDGTAWDSASINLSGVNITADTITTTAAHGFAAGTAVSFDSNGVLPSTSSGIPLTAGKRYFIGSVSASVFKLYATYDDAMAGTNPIDLTSQGSGTNPAHAVRSLPPVLASCNVQYVYHARPSGVFGIVFAGGLWADSYYALAGAARWFNTYQDSFVPYIGYARTSMPSLTECQIGAWFATSTNVASASTPLIVSAVFFGNRATGSPQ